MDVRDARIVQVGLLDLVETERREPFLHIRVPHSVDAVNQVEMARHECHRLVNGVLVHVHARLHGRILRAGQGGRLHACVEKERHIFVPEHGADHNAVGAGKRPRQLHEIVSFEVEHAHIALVAELAHKAFLPVFVDLLLANAAAHKLGLHGLDRLRGILVAQVNILFEEETA